KLNTPIGCPSRSIGTPRKVLNPALRCCSLWVYSGSRLCKNATFMVGQPPAVGPRGPVSCADRFHQSANAQNAHHPLHVVGQDVQRHFGTDVLERLHLEVRRSHPRLYRAEGVLDSLAAYAHLIWIPIEPGLHGLKDGFVLPT